MAELYKDPSAPIEERVEDLLARMTQEEKVGQLTQFCKRQAYKDDDQGMCRDIAAGMYGSRILSDGGFAGNEGAGLSISDCNLSQRAAVEDSRLGIPLIYGRDVIYGQKVLFPIPLAQSCSWNPQLIEESYTCIAREAAAVSVHWSFAPMMDIARDPRWGRIIEGSGEDPYLAARCAEAAVRGFQGDDPSDPERILACAKHYVAYGAAEGGRDYDRCQLGDNELHNVYLVPFKAACAAGCATVMAGFQQIDNVPASGNRYTLTEILKLRWNWDGFVVSDWGSVEQLKHHGYAETFEAAAERAMNAGVDMEMTANLYNTHLAELVADGRVEQERVDDAVRRVLRAKFKAGLFERPYVDEQLHERVLGCEEHMSKALELAEQCPVLVRNEGGILPLDRTASVAVVGPFASERRAHFGSWCLDADLELMTSIVEGIEKAAPEAWVRVAESTSADAELGICRSGIWSGAGGGSDVAIVCVGEHQVRNGEASNIAHLELPPGQEALIEAIGRKGIPMVVVNCAGRPLAMPAAERYAQAILYAWNLGTRAGDAIARILYGDAEPTGRLSVSIAQNEGQVPVYYNRHFPGKIGGYEDRYQYYLDQHFAPLYPFGFGLGYTTWSYDDIALDREEITPDGSLTVSATVSNTGARRGTTVVQCYVQDIAGSTARPVRELKGFRRVTLDAGASEQVSFTLGADELAFYTAERTWRVERGGFKVWIGGDSRADLEAGFRVV